MTASKHGPPGTRRPARSDRSVLWSVVGHGLLLLLVLVGGLSLPHKPQPTQLAIKATVVESPANRPARSAPLPAPKVEPAAEPAAEPKPEPKPEPEPEPEPKVEPPPRPDPALERRKAEQEKERAAAAVAKREAALKEQAAEKERQQKAAADKAAAAKAEAEKAARAKAEADQARAAKAAARERELELAEEERLLAATDSGAIDAYSNLIRQKVERYWIRPASAGPDIECEVSVTQIPGGEVTDVRIGRCNADDAVRRSIEAAVRKASPLPLPEVAALFDRNLRFVFKPEQ